MAGHDPCLATNRHQNVPITEHEDEDLDDDERDEVPDSVSNCGHAALPEEIPVADSVNHGACRKYQGHAVHDRVSNFVESTFESSFELFEFLLDEIFDKIYRLIAVLLLPVISTR